MVHCRWDKRIERPLESWFGFVDENASVASGAVQTFLPPNHGGNQNNTDNLLTITAGPDGDIWVGAKTFPPEVPTLAFYRYTTLGTLLSTVAVPVTNINQAVSGPDQAVWFVNSGGQEVDRVTATSDSRGIALPVRFKAESNRQLGR